MPKLSEEQQAKRRAQILDAAEACFARSGFHRTTMQDIRREAGLSAGALYVWFDSKEALIEGLVFRDRAEILEKFAQVPLTGDFAEGLAALLRSCVVDMPIHKARLMVEINAEASRNPAVASTVSQCDASIRGSLRALISRAVEDRRIAPALSADDLAGLMMVVADGMFFRKATDPSFDCAASAPQVIAMLSGLLTVRDARSSTPADPDRELVHDA